MLKSIIIFFFCLLSGSLAQYSFDPFDNFDSSLLENKTPSNVDFLSDLTKDSFRTKIGTRNLIPSFYDLRITPYFDPAEDESVRFTVPGTLRIQIKCTSKTQTIELNSKEIIIDYNSTKIVSQSNLQELKIKEQEVDLAKESFRITLIDSLNEGESYEIFLKFTSKVFLSRLSGLYLSNYTHASDKSTRYLVVTHFEPQSARLLFPSFDEPDLKAYFNVSVGRRAQYNTLSNMDLVSSEQWKEDKNWFWDHFSTSVKMSTYLVAITISEFTSASADSKMFGGKPVKIWGSKHDIEEREGGKFAANTAAKILEHYEKLFRAKYPLPKMDSVAVPHFQAGAMENYGLNLYREKLLLYFNDETTEGQRYSICSVVAHELAHQWFGNLVTCKSWAQVWLNEGFSAFAQNIGAEAACPEFEPWEMFSSSTLQTAMKYDTTSNSHPVVNDTDPTIRFSRIVYNKGASLLRMIREVLGRETFDTGVQNYLKKLSFDNAHSEDLFDSLTEQGSMDGTLSNYTTISKIMEKWTQKKGYPLLRVALAASNRIYISQEEFLKPKFIRDARSFESLEDKIFEEGDELWWIPIKIISKSHPDFRNRRLDFWLPDYMGTMLKTGVDASNWILVNPDAIGYYRTLYDEELSKRLIKQLIENHSVFTPNTRGQLIDDYFTFAFNNYISINKALDFTQYLEKETSYTVWSAVFTNLRKSYILLSNTPAMASFKHYLGPKLSKALNLIGLRQLSEERGIKVVLRSQLLDWARKFGEIGAENYASELFANWMKSPQINSIPIDIQSVVYCTAARTEKLGDIEIWNFLIDRYKSDKATTRQKSLLLNALTCTTNEKNILSILEKLYTEESIISNSDSSAFLLNLIQSPLGRTLALQFLHSHSEKIFEQKNGATLVLSLLSQLKIYLKSAEDLDSVKKFIESNESNFGKSYGYVLNSTVEGIEENRIWMSKYYEPMNLWFEYQTTPNRREKIQINHVH